MAELNKFKIQLKDLNGQLMFPNTTAAQVLGLSTVINNAIDVAIEDSLKTTSVMSFQGTVGESGTFTELPIAYRGFTYMVATAGTYAGHECEVGDLIICTGNDSTDGKEPTVSYWTVIQTNLVGAVTGSLGAEAGKIVLSSSEHVIETLNDTIGSEYAGVYVAEGKLAATTQTYAAFQVNVEDENTLSISVFDYDPVKGFKPIDVDKKVTGAITSPDKSVHVAWALDEEGNPDVHKVELTLGTVVTGRIEALESRVIEIGTDLVQISSKVSEVEQKIDAKIAESAQGGSAFGTINGLVAGNSSDTLTVVSGTGLVIATAMTLATGTRTVDGEETEYTYQTGQTITLSVNTGTGLTMVDGAITVDSAGLVAANSGLKVEDGKIALNLGSGLEVTNNAVAVKIATVVQQQSDNTTAVAGAGLTYTADGALSAMLLFDYDGQIVE